MKKIATLSEQILEELGDAESYARLACSLKYEDPGLAETYHRLSQDEFRHMDELHKQASRIVGETLKSGLKPTSRMQARWDDMHFELMDRRAAVKALIASWDD